MEAEHKFLRRKQTHRSDRNTEKSPIQSKLLFFSVRDPPLRSSARLSSNTYLFRDLTTHSSQLFFSIVIGRVPGRGGMWKEAQLEQQQLLSSKSFTSFRWSKQTFQCFLRIFRFADAHSWLRFYFRWHAFLKHARADTRARASKPFQQTDVSKATPWNFTRWCKE